MDDNWDLTQVGRFCQQILEQRKNEDYIINQPQMAKFIALHEFFKDAAKKYNGEIESVDLVPREESGGITVGFVVFYAGGKNVQRFCDVMRGCSSFTIDSTTDGKVRISCTVPKVFVRKGGKV